VTWQSSRAKEIAEGVVVTTSLLTMNTLEDRVIRSTPTVSINSSDSTLKMSSNMRKTATKPESYSGPWASLEAPKILAKFEKHAAYFEWTEDRLFQLLNSLTGTAATVFWAGGKQATSTEIIQLLKDQHGSDNQSEQCCIELRACR